MLRPSPAQSLIRLDPDLGERLSPERLELAGRQLWVRVVGPISAAWCPGQWSAVTDADGIGLLVVSGIIVRELCVHDAPSAELFGPGDVIRACQSDQPELLPAEVRWSALEPAAVALLDSGCAVALRRFPEVMTVILDRFNARAERLAVTQAISQLTGIEMRVETLLWHLAERWGRVGPEGMIVSVALSHRMIGSLVGARRPTVSTAIARLATRRRLTRRPDGTWVLTGSRPPSTDAPRKHPFLADPPPRGARDRRPGESLARRLAA